LEKYRPTLPVDKPNCGVFVSIYGPHDVLNNVVPLDSCTQRDLGPEFPGVNILALMNVTTEQYVIIVKGT
jgi:hypothetical protein